MPDPTLAMDQRRVEEAHKIDYILQAGESETAQAQTFMGRTLRTEW